MRKHKKNHTNGKLSPLTVGAPSNGGSNQSIAPLHSPSISQTSSSANAIPLPFSQLTSADTNSLRHRLLPVHHHTHSSSSSPIARKETANEPTTCPDPNNCTISNQSKFGYHFPLSGASFSSCPNVYVAAAAAAAAASASEPHSTAGSSGNTFYGNNPIMTGQTPNTLLDSRNAMMLSAMQNARGKKRERQLSNSFNGRFLSYTSDNVTTTSELKPLTDSIAKTSIHQTADLLPMPVSSSSASASGPISSTNLITTATPNVHPHHISTVAHSSPTPFFGAAVNPSHHSTMMNGPGAPGSSSLNCLANAANLAQTGALAAFGYHPPTGSYAMGSMDASQLQADVHSLEQSLIGQHLYGSIASNVSNTDYVPKLFTNGSQAGGWPGTALGYSAAAAAGLNARAGYYGCYGAEFEH